LLPGFLKQLVLQSLVMRSVNPDTGREASSISSTARIAAMHRQCASQDTYGNGTKWRRFHHYRTLCMWWHERNREEPRIAPEGLGQQGLPSAAHCSLRTAGVVKLAARTGIAHLPLPPRQAMKAAPADTAQAACIAVLSFSNQQQRRD